MAFETWKKWILFFVPLLVFFVLRRQPLIAAFIGFLLVYGLTVFFWYQRCRQMQGRYWVQAIWPALPVFVVFFINWIAHVLPLSQFSVILYAATANILTFILIGVATMAIYMRVNAKMGCLTPAPNPPAPNPPAPNPPAPQGILVGQEDFMVAGPYSVSEEEIYFAR